MKLKVNILILNYNGAALLRKYLPSFRAAVKASAHDCRLTVLDNASADESLAVLAAEFPDVLVHRAPENLVLCSYNEAAASLDDDVVIFMNNDIRAEENFVDPLVRPFLEAKDVFFVTPRCLSPDGRYEGNKTKAEIRYGVFWSSAIYPGHEAGAGRPGRTFQGGFGAFDRRKFLELGGYDALYLPGRLEDADVCFRAQRKGWRCLYEPGSVVYHEGGTSFHKRFGVRKTLVINWRNTFLFMWKNLSDTINFFEFPLWFPVRAAHSLATGKPEFLLGFFEALPRFGQARARRRQVRRAEGPAAVPDGEIFARSIE